MVVEDGVSRRVLLGALGLFTVGGLLSACSSGGGGTPGRINTTNNNGGDGGGPSSSPTSTGTPEPNAGRTVDPVAGSILKRVDAVRAHTEDYIMLPTDDPKYVEALKVLEQQFLDATSGKRLFPLLDAGFTLTAEDIKQDAEKPYLYDAKWATPDGDKEGYLMRFAVRSVDSIKVFSGEWLEGGKKWMRRNEEYTMRWSR